jgi:hypothetical protein
LSAWKFPQEWREKYRSISSVIGDQPWFFQWWKRDPTITSALNMLDAIDDKFRGTDGFYEKLTNTDRPFITFQLLDLANFGLSDDLYIKMNARGKPLTAFEVFKARLEGHIASVFANETKPLHGSSVPVKDYFSHKIDTDWADLFWEHRNEDDLFDDEVMNLVRAVAIVTRSPESSDFESYVDELRRSDSVSFQKYLDIGCLDRNHLELLMLVLDHFSGGDSKEFTGLLPSNIHFDEKKIFERILNDGRVTTYKSLLQFYAYAEFVRNHTDNLEVPQLEEWIRVIFNLTINSNIERPEEFRNALRSINSLIPNSRTILSHLANEESKIQGFSIQQIQEEKVKARLVLRSLEWKELIIKAEAHGYFRGQIEFLLDFSGVLHAARKFPTCAWNDTENRKYLDDFSVYFQKATSLFFSGGLKSLGNFHAERALLAIGDYTLKEGPNFSFVENSENSSSSWKRLLRGDLNDPGEGRIYLKGLIDRIPAKGSVVDALDTVIERVIPEDIWRRLLASNPLLIKYCVKRQFRFNNPENIFLLKGQRRNGEHVELFTYHLYTAILLPRLKAGKLSPYSGIDYNPVSTDDVVPSISLWAIVNGTRIFLTIWNYGISKFKFRVRTEDENLLEQILNRAKGEVEEDSVIIKTPLDIDQAEKLVNKIGRILTKQMAET